MAELNAYNRFLTILTTFHFRNLAERNDVTVTGAMYQNVLLASGASWGKSLEDQQG